MIIFPRRDPYDLLTKPSMTYLLNLRSSNVIPWRRIIPMLGTMDISRPLPVFPSLAWKFQRLISQSARLDYFLSQPKFQCAFKIRLFFWWFLVRCFPYIVTYTQSNSYFEALSPRWKDCKKTVFCRETLTIIFQGQCVSFQGVNTPKV